MTRVVWLTRLLGLGALVLVGVTWKLWTPQEVYPRVPLFRWAPPDLWDWMSLALIVFGAAGLLVNGAWQRRSFATLLAVGFAMAIVADQHRLQPWAWQFLILSSVITLADDRTILHGWRWLTISIYFYSALSKFDEMFIRSTGQQLTGAMIDFGNAVHFDWMRFMSPAMLYLEFQQHIVPWILPPGELAVALLLTWPRTRWWGLWLSLFLHGSLLIMLGPFGLNHRPGVLVWNLFFASQNLMLFKRRNDEAHGLQPVGFNVRLARGLLAFVLIWPLGEPWGWCDAWPGWAVYVPRFHEGRIFLAQADYHQLPREYRLHGDRWPDRHQRYLMPVWHWSLVALDVPKYPNHRLDIATALDLCERLQTTDIVVEVRTRRRLFDSWGETDVSLNSYDAVIQYADTFWFNAYPTSMYRRNETSASGGP